MIRCRKGLAGFSVPGVLKTVSSSGSGLEKEVVGPAVLGAVATAPMLPGSAALLPGRPSTSRLKFSAPPTRICSPLERARKLPDKLLSRP